MQGVETAVPDVILRDGRTLRLRPPAEGDRDALVEFFERLSPLSIYRRFHGIPRIGAQLVEPLLVSNGDRGGLVGTLDGRVVAVCRLRPAARSRWSGRRSPGTSGGRGPSC